MVQPYGLSLLQNYPEWLALSLMVGGFSMALTGVLYLAAKRYRLLPSIRDRDVHTEKKPRVGGVAMLLTVVVSLTTLLTIAPDKVSFGGQEIWGIDRSLIGILGGCLVLLVFGLWDDVSSLKPSTQLVGQVLAALVVIWGGVQVDYINIPFAETRLQLNGTTWFIPEFLGGGVIWPLSALFSLIWILLMINVMNFFDGLDGLAGSVGLVGAVILFFVCLRLGFIAPATLALLVFAAVAGFLPWNWYPSKIFMGTVGSQLLGFMLGVIAIISGAKVATAVLVLGIPLLDAVVVVGRRLLAGKSPFQADQRHLHHRLLHIGLSTPMVVIVITSCALIFGVVSLRTQDTNGKGLLTLALIAAMLVFIAVTYALEKRATRKVH
jgi:UDP-GlcNAc:undecaprenyl-phosphate GlcNAc-1-phosphate transferase